MNGRKGRSRRFAALGLSAFFALGVAALAFEPAGPVAPPTDWTATTPDLAQKIASPNAEVGEILELTGNGASSEWRSAPLALEPRKLYRVEFDASTTKPGFGDCAPVGTSFAHYDFRGFKESETPQKTSGFTFFVPDGVESSYLRLAQWETTRVYRFANVRAKAVAPFYRLLSGSDESEYLALGTGESLQNGEYSFRAFANFAPTDFDRPLFSTTSGFNTSRWTLSGTAEVVYRFALEATRLEFDETFDGASDKTERLGKIAAIRKLPFASGSISGTIGHYVGGTVLFEASRDGENWMKLGETSGLGEEKFSLDALFAENGGAPIDEIFVRLRGADGEGAAYCNAQIYGFGADLTLASDARVAAFGGDGKTTFAELSDAPSADSDASNWALWGETENGWIARDGARFIALTADSELISRVEPTSEPTENEKRFPAETRFVANFARPATFGVFEYPYFCQDYAREIAGLGGETGGVSFSWCEQDYRVPRDPKRVEILPPESAKIFAAKNDYESFQVVLRAGERPIIGVDGTVLGDLTNENGEKIAAENVDLRYGYYHFVERPTDRICAVGYYEDALVPLERGADGRGAALVVESGRNLPIWITVKTPADAAPGTYRGAVRLKSDGGGAVQSDPFDVEIPFELILWDFALPAKNEALETAFGSSPGTIFRYHNCETEADKRAVWEKYLQIYGDYRIGIYDPAPFDGIDVEWLPNEDPPRCELDFSRFDAEMKRVFEKYNFTNFRLNFQGLGGGTYENRSPGLIAGFAADTPEYRAMAADYGKKLQEHLREIGLLDAAYVYWFDEPEPKDYEFCANGFAILNKYAPEIAGMLTEEPSEEFANVLENAGANIDIWCPISNLYSDESAAPERAKGNRFWQYVCTGPKEPYCAEFTDHPAIELRIWHWQMFERDIVGSLIWTTNWWTSDLAFPEEAQDPYRDPESYMGGYNFPVGTVQRWGNGDGRFVYPPLTAATPGRNGGKPIFDAPNVSMRLEMLREGVQDYEMLAKLKGLAKTRKLTEEQRKRVEEIFDFSSITTDMTTFSIDPRRIYEKRRAVAELIVELSASPLRISRWVGVK